MPLFTIETPQELDALWRLVLDAKFQTELRDRDLWASPYVHELARRIDEARLHSYEIQGRSELIGKHLDWRKSFFQNTFVHQATKSRLKELIQSDWWKTQDQQTRVAFVRGCVAPYELEDSELAQLLTEAEA